MDKQKTYSEIINAVASEVKKVINEAYGPDLTPEQEFYVECIERRNNGETWSSLAREFNMKFGRNISPDAMRGRVNTAMKYYSSKPNVEPVQETIPNTEETPVTPTVETNKPTDNVVITGNDGLTYTFVDLGLPSGTLWCNINVGAMCKKTAKSWYGDYYAWGEIETKDSFEWNNYKWTNGIKISKGRYVINGKKRDVVLPKSMKKYQANQTRLLPEDDTARVIIGGGCKMPKIDDINELLTLENAWVYDYNGIRGLNGVVFYSNNGNSVFFPAAGEYLDNRVIDAGTWGVVASSSLDEDVCGDWKYTHAHVMTFMELDDPNDSPADTEVMERREGAPVRAVLHK